MTEIYDDSLEGSIIEIPTPTIEPKPKPHFKEGLERRFKTNIHKKIKADEPILNYLKDKGEWASSREMIDKLGMADRTVFHICKRLAFHGAIDMKTEHLKEENGRNTRLYRIPIKKENDT